MTWKPLSGLFSCVDVSPKRGKSFPDYGNFSACHSFLILIFNDLKNGTGIGTKEETGKSDAEKTTTSRSGSWPERLNPSSAN
jgi:hypothetical protein